LILSENLKKEFTMNDKNIIHELTDIGTYPDEIELKRKELWYKKQRVIDWHASKGLMYIDSETFKLSKRVSATSLAAELSISRQTIYDWPTTIPNLARKVAEARHGLNTDNVSSVWNSVYL
jgi:hypothetical protein